MPLSPNIPTFYKIDVEREVVLQGKTTSFITISRNDDSPFGSLTINESLYIIGFPQAYTFEERAEIVVTNTSPLPAPPPAPFLTQTISFSEVSPLNSGTPSFTRVSGELVIRNWWDLDPTLTVADAPVKVVSYSPGVIDIETSSGALFSAPVPNGTVLKLGVFVEEDGNNFKINAASASHLANAVYNASSGDVLYTYESTLPNPFDGTIWSGQGSGTGFITRKNPFWTKVEPQPVTIPDGNEKTNSVTIRIDYDGASDAHLKINFLIFKNDLVTPPYSSPYNMPPAMPVLLPSEVTWPFGLKSGDGLGAFNKYADYQEIHIFGYPEDYVKPSRDNSTADYPILKPLYDDRSSYGLLKTNPKLSGNVKVTVDSKGDIWMNSFDANEELSDATYKKFAINPNSTYQKDLYNFFKNGQTPSDIVFDLYEYDDQYLNSKQSYSQQFDNFYNYGVEQLKSKFYDENFTFLAPIWLRKNLPDYFVILRVDHPINPDTYIPGVNLENTIKDYMNGARIIKTFDLRATSKMGAYIRNLVNDPRWRERPLEFSWDANTPTYWSGAVYTDGTLSSKGELIYDYIEQDRLIKEFEDFITGGFQRNNIISTNLLNLEFLFDDEEAPLYSINRYIGFYVTENQLAEFEIEPTVLGKIGGQTPLPKPGVDGQPYSIKPFVQTNNNGIQIPVHYYHNTPFANNTSIIPAYQGLVIGKFPLPAMVDDPLRLFYVRDRDNIFKKVRKLSEVNYGSPLSPDFVRATQLELFDTQEDISKYGGVTDIVSQFPATLLDSGHAQLRLHLLDQFGTGCIVDDEELIFEVKKYNNPGSKHKYHAQVIDFVPGVSATVEYFIDQNIVVNATSFDQPLPGKNTPLLTYSPAKDLIVGETVYLVTGGYYSVVSAPSNTSVILKNLGGGFNAAPTTFSPLFTPGTLYSTANNIPTTGGSGTGLTVNITAVAGAVTQIEIESAGDGYAPGDLITIAQIGSGLDAQFTITSVNNIGSGSLLGSSISGSATYNVNPLDTYLSIDNYMKLNLVDFGGGYSIYDAWEIELDAPSIQKFILNGTNDIDAEYTPQYQQFRWRMQANGVGLQPGDAWDYPVLDPNGVDYVSNFSNEGRLDQVAKAIAKCINSFESLPVQAWQDGSEIYMRSTLLYEEGNTIEFKRVLRGNSYYANIGFYEVGNVDRGNALEVKTLQITPSTTTDTYDIEAKVLLQPDQITNTSYLVQVTRGDFATNINIRVGVNPSTWALATTTGVPYIFNIPTKDEFFVDPNIPLTFNLKKIPVNTNGSWVYTQTSSPTTQQYFVGGQKRLRNRARIESLNGQNYYQDRKVVRPGDTTAGSPIILIDSSGMYVGAPISGSGIPAGAKIVDVNVGNVVMNVNATTTATGVKITAGELSILNDNLITQQWYQSLKSVFSRMKGWEVQGKYIYSLPYLDQPTYDVENYLNGFTNYKNYSIIQLDKADQEFYYSNDQRIVAYKVYRPTFGVFSIYPIKEFDFDFLFSEYSYTPTLEIFKYFFKEEALDGEYVELELFNNYKISQFDNAGASDQSAYTLEIEAYDIETNTWTSIDTINKQSLTGSELLINTFYPAYDYDMKGVTVSPPSAGLPDGYPYLAPDPGNTNPSPLVQSRAAGFRNFDRRYLLKLDPVTKESVKFYPEKLRVKYIKVGLSTAEKIVITNYNYENDNDLKLFNGFAGIQDITSINDAQVIENFKQDGQYIEALTYQLLLSEYDRLRENFTKDWAVKSKTVPYINKWVQEGTDARDNYYRLDTSLAFGLSNLSPSSAVDFAEPSVLTHEFPYLDAIPQDYPTGSLETSRSYFFEKLDTVAWRGRTWYDLITSNVVNDWFLKYFSLGYPTEKLFGGEKIPKSRDERYTFFLYNNGIGKSQTLFRGAKIQITQYEAGPNITTPLSTPIANSTAFEGYKFSAIARFQPYEPITIEKPVDIEVIKNDKFKTITMILTIKIKDYRTQSGHIDYALQYFANDILKNTNQNQLKINPNIATVSSTELRNFLPYDGTYGSYDPYTSNAVMRPRQGFLGGGYLQLGDKKIGGLVNYTPTVSPEWNPATGQTQAQLYMSFDSVDPVTYQFSLLNEITTINNNYRVNGASYPFVQDTGIIGYVWAKEFGLDGYEFNIHSAAIQPTLAGGNFTFWNFVDSQDRVDILTIDSIIIGSANNYNRFRTFSIPGGVLLQSAIASPFQIAIPGSVPLNSIKETYFVNGGTDGFQSIKNYITFGNIQSLINSNSPLIEYYNVTDAGKVPAFDFRLNIVNPDSLVKTNVLNTATDEDKPTEYQSTSLIGYNIVDTNGQEFITRHRGYYEPKTRDILTFWVREDDNFSKHFELDFLLSNTHINAKSALSGLVRNYGINKVATGGDVMAISTGSSYKSLYPLIGEVAVTNKDFNAFTSSWDKDFYRNYQTTTNFTEVYGIAEMQETKAFLASKAMNVPKQFDLHSYIDGVEYTFELIQPAAEIGVDALAANNAAVQQGLPYSNKPKVIITINIEEKLRRELLAGIDNPNNVDEFARLTTLGINELNALSPVEILNLKTQYINKNIINIYQVTDVLLYSLQQQGVDIVDGELTEVQKVRAGYRVDKDCVVTKLSDFKFQITKILNPAVPVGFSFSATVKRI